MASSVDAAGPALPAPEPASARLSRALPLLCDSTTLETPPVLPEVQTTGRQQRKPVNSPENDSVDERAKPTPTVVKLSVSAEAVRPRGRIVAKTARVCQRTTDTQRYAAVPPTYARPKRRDSLRDLQRSPKLSRTSSRSRCSFFHHWLHVVAASTRRDLLASGRKSKSSPVILSRARFA